VELGKPSALPVDPDLEVGRVEEADPIEKRSSV